MKKPVRYVSLLPIYALILMGLIITALFGSRAVTVLSENAPVADRKCVVIDAGHGGEDGGASGKSGVLESYINLQVALRLDDLMHLLGIDTVMIRTTDRSVYTKGETLAAKKVSDLKERVRLINETDDALMVSIHQNHFTDSRYKGAQVFYAPTGGSREVATILQSEFIRTLNNGSKRQPKKADGIYLMQKISCAGILVECGFLSNPEEEALLQDPEYQNKICCVIASVCSTYLHGDDD